MAGLTELPVIIRDLDEAAAMEVALIENLQRSDLNPMEEAMGYQELMQQHGYTQEQVAKRVGKSRPAVANALRLLALPEETARLVRDGKLSSGHARALLGLPEAGMIPALAERICQEGLSVRETERLVGHRDSTQGNCAQIRLGRGQLLEGSRTCHGRESAPQGEDQGGTGRKRHSDGGFLLPGRSHRTGPTAL